MPTRGIFSKRNGAYEYFEVSTGASEKRTILSSPELLAARRLVDLLNHHQWFHSNIVLQGLEDSQLAAPEEWIYGGKYPLLSLHCGLDEVVYGFRDWVQSQCARIVNQRR